MKTTDLIPWVTGYVAFLIGLFLGVFFFGMLIHESSHAIICLLFQLPFSWSLTQIVYIRSPNPLVNILVGLAGGMGQALFSLFFFWYSTFLEKRILAKNFFNKLFRERRLPILSILFGFEVAFLTIAFHGVINAIWEGLFYRSYVQIHDVFVLWWAIILICGLISFYIIYRRYLLLTQQK